MFELVQNSPFLISINIIMLIVMWFTMRPAIHYADGVVSTGRLYFTLLMWFAFDIFAFWGSDWFHLYVKYQDIMNGEPMVEHIYTWIAHDLAPFNYILFRIIVWGAAQLLLWDTFKRLSVSSHLLLAVFVSIWMIWFSFGRVSLAMALVFWGLTIYHKSSNIPFLNKFVGLFAIVISLYFHKSSIFLIFVALLTILARRVNKVAFLLCLFTIPFFIYLFSKEFIDSLMTIMANEMQEMEEYMIKAQFYMEADKSNNGIGPLIGMWLEKLPFYLIAILSLVAEFKDAGYQKEQSYEEVLDTEKSDGETCDADEEMIEYDTCIPEDIKVFIRALFFIVFLSSFFLINISLNTQVLYDRFIKFSLIPATVILAYLLDTPKYVRYAWLTYGIALLGTCYQMTYMLYCSITNAK